jgi:hypothetical protein
MTKNREDVDMSQTGLWLQQSLLKDAPQCVTLQINATLYSRTGLVRETVILRDPTANVELARGIALQAPYDTWVLQHAERWGKVLTLLQTYRDPF